MLTVQCAMCGKTFGAQRKTATFCSTNCRVKATRARARQQQDVPMRRDGPQLLALPPKNPAQLGLLLVTEQALTEAKRHDTPMGQATLLLARILDSGVQDTGSSIAALVRQYQASLEKALDGADQAVDALDEILNRRRRA